MLTAFKGPALIDLEVESALRRTAEAHSVRYGDLLNVVVTCQLQRVPGLPDPEGLAEIAGLKVTEARDILVALHADGWVSTSDTNPTLHPPHTVPDESATVAPRSPLAKYDRAWVDLGGESLGEFGCRRLYATLSKTAPYIAPTDWKDLMVGYRKLYPEADLGAFLKAALDATPAMRQCILALLDVGEMDLVAVHEQSRKIGGAWTRTATTRSPSDPWLFLFAALRGVKPDDIARSPHFLSDAIEGALCRARSIKNERLGEIALRYRE